MSKWYFCSNHDVFFKELKVIEVVNAENKEIAKEVFIKKYGKARMKTIRIKSEHEIKKYYPSDLK